MRSLRRSGSSFGLALALVLVAAAACGPLNTAPATPGAAPVTAGSAEVQGAQAAETAKVEAAKAEAAKVEAAKPKPPTEEEIKKLSYDLLGAWDRGDVAKMEELLAPEFLHFEAGHGLDREENLKVLRNRRPGAPYIATRAWEDERVRIHGDIAMFTGKATEREGGNDKKGNYKYVGFYLLEWARHGDAWKARLWTWQRGGEDETRSHWNSVYREGVGFERKPNRLLVETIQGKRPGAALDLAMGQGRNALHLAAHGWKVTGVDISDEGLRLAREEAGKRKLALETINANIDTYDFGKNRWDLITMIYAGANVPWVEKVKPALRPGGLFIVEFFAREPDAARGGFAPGQLAKLLADGFEILRDEVVEDEPDWAKDRAKLVRFVARKR
jgi:SAM-dependent methyltransferase